MTYHDSVEKDRLEIEGDRRESLDQEPLTINETDKLAKTLAVAPMRDDFYHQSIVKSARVMVEKGFLDWKYHTSWSSGTCLFYSPEGNQCATVRPYEQFGKVSIDRR